MGADKGALVALDAEIGNPDRHLNGNAALFIAGCPQGDHAVRLEGAYRQPVTLQLHHGVYHFADILRCFFGNMPGSAFCNGPAFRVANLLYRFYSLLHNGDIFFHHFGALLAVRFLDHLLHFGKGERGFNYSRCLEEGSLHNYVDSSAQAFRRGDLNRIDVIKLQLLPGDGPLHLRRQPRFHLLQAPGRVQQEDAALFDSGQEIVAGNVGGIMAGHEVGLLDQVGRLDRLGAEAQVRDSDPT